MINQIENMNQISESIYVDHAATTPIRTAALEILVENFRQCKNPSSLHQSGRKARMIVEDARELLAENVECKPSEIVFTSGGTEANNVTIKGVGWEKQKIGKNILVSSTIEHHAILDPMKWMEKEQKSIVRLMPVDEYGCIDIEHYEEFISEHNKYIAVISIMLANNEVGTIQDISKLARIAKKYGCFFHTDAIQALGQLSIHFSDMGVDAMTISSHKVGGPVGVGALIINRDVSIVPLFHGGEQEQGIRSGTIPVAAIASFAQAVREAVKNQEQHIRKMKILQEKLINIIAEKVPDAVFNGTKPGKYRLSNNVHFSFPGCDGDTLLMLLDAYGVECSTGSACSAGIPQPSHVLLAMGSPHDLAKGSLRFSFGHTSRESDVDYIGNIIAEVVSKSKQAGMVNAR